ncbi:cytochrome P450 [Nocardioides sp. WS12]|uniref:cytochrome P450 n=1 Tax=Nocardioides sp. WS12 TaxID=2486272 RepID=UPI0015FCBD3A|nr:cytochrome P450 [Nocardioides sp. WS12]
MSNKVIVDFDHHSPEVAKQGVDAWNALREASPIAYSSKHGGFWVVSDYEGVAEVARNDTDFSSNHDVENDRQAGCGIMIPPTSQRFAPIEYDPPLHGAMRKLLLPWFSRSKADDLEPVVRQAATVAIDRFIETGVCDLVHDFASEVPAVATLALYNMEHVDAKMYAQTFHMHMYAASDPDVHHQVIENMAIIDADVEAMIDDRRRSPRENDIVSALVHSEVLGEQLTVQQIKDNMRALLGGGLDTTASLTATTLAWLGQNPDAIQRLRDEPDLYVTATEEFLRCFAPTPALSRTMKNEYDMRGNIFAPGERVMMSWLGANHDPQEFEDPDQVNLERVPNRHTSFGIGAHRCIGSHFARMEFEILIQEVLNRLPDFKIDYERAQKYPSLGIMNGYINLPATFTPGPRVQ